MFISGTKTSKKAENVLMTWNAPDDHQHLTDEQYVNQIKELVHKNRRLTIRDFADTIRISRGSLDTVSKDNCLGRQLVVFASR